MSTRSELLFRAYGKISNPFVLCTLISKRTRQFMMGANENRGTAELVDYALSELLAGVLEFEMHGEKDAKGKAPQSHSILIAASRDVLEVEAK